MRKLLATIALPQFRTESFMALLPVLITVFLWLVILVMNFTVAYEHEVPPLPFLPLYAFYPGLIVSGQINSHPVYLHAWGLGAAIIFLALAFIAVRNKNKSAGLAFLALFLISTVIVYARLVDEVRSLNLH
jgi:hypothetical protein